MTRYAITDRKIVSPDERTQMRLLIEAAARWAHEGVDFIQLREKDLSAGEMVILARMMKSVLAGSQTKLLINSRLDVALAAGADGVHLTSRLDELKPSDVRKLMPSAVVSISCHSLEEVERAVTDKVDLILFGPVFEKKVDGKVVVEGKGWKALREVCAAADPVPVLALGGVTQLNSEPCLTAGASGIAGIRLFL